ncbi:hypothetical protein DFH29DRAFT_1010900 [Suillus ampliporus]|nr:hypothetical protein DFH29DRAFT_1010900 [Suillus ampliporus]
MTPKVWPNWHSIGYDDPRLMKHSWHSKVIAWEALGDRTLICQSLLLLLTGPIPVDLPSPPVVASNVPGSSTNPTTEYRDKGKAGFAWSAGGHPSPLSKIVARTPNSPRSPQVPTKKPSALPWRFPGSRPAVVEPSQPTPDSPVEAPAVIEAGDILIPGPNNPCHACNKLEWPCATRFDKRTRSPCMSCVYCSTKKIKCISATLGSPPTCTRAPSTTQRARSRTPSKAPSKAPPASQLKARTCSQSCGLSGTPAVTAVTTPKTQTHGRSKTITAIKAPAPAPARMSPTPTKFEDASAIEGLLFESNEVVDPEGPHTSGKNVDPGDPGNLVPEYDSDDDMDVEVKVEVKVEDTDMAT